MMYANLSGLHRWPTLASVLLITGLVLTANVRAEHPYHISNAEIQYNAKTKTFEVAICLWAEDVETRFRETTGKPFDLDALKNSDQVLAKYFRQRFVISDSERKPLLLHWQGHEIENQRLWVYFEVDCRIQPESCQVENRILFDLSDQQVNLMQIKVGDQVKSISATISRPRITFQK